MMAHLGLAIETVLNRSTFATHLIPVDWLQRRRYCRAAAVVRQGGGERDRQTMSAIHR